jgi:hypothetical protein
VAPDGRDALVMSDVGTSPAVVGLTVTLDDEAGGPLPSLDPLSSGTFQPTNIDPVDSFPLSAPTPSGNVALSICDGGNPTGNWQRFVVDDGNVGVGSLGAGWSLQITAKVKKKTKR